MVIKVKNNGEWVKIPYLSSDNNPIIPEAPLDGKQYARQSGEWTVVNIPEVDFTEINQKISQNTAAIASNTTAIQSKVDKVDGFGLSSNDYTSQEKTKLAGLNNYTLPTASDTVKGGIKVGTGLTMNGEVLTVDVTKSYVDTQLATKANASNVYTKAEVNSKVSSVYRVKGAVASYAKLPTVDVTIGDVYNISDTGANYVAVSTTPTWDKLSETVNLSGYATTAAMNSALGNKVDKVSGKALSTNDYTTTEKNKLAGIAANANNYSLPTATSSVLGGVKTGSNITNSSGTISLSSSNVTSALGYTPVKNESGIASIRVMTQSAYDELSSKSATTLYVII